MAGGRYGLGIDPGIHGAVGAAYDRVDGRIGVDVFDMPTAPTVVSGKRRDRVDPHALFALLAGLAMGAPGLALQEEVWARPIRKLTPKGIIKISRDPGTMLQLGMAAGISLGQLAAHSIPFRLIPPGDWKKAMGVPGDKDAARLFASRLLPDCAHLWPLKKHDGRAEAALLAVYALRQLER